MKLVKNKLILKISTLIILSGSLIILSSILSQNNSEQTVVSQSTLLVQQDHSDKTLEFDLVDHTGKTLTEEELQNFPLLNDESSHDDQKACLWIKNWKNDWPRYRFQDGKLQLRFFRASNGSTANPVRIPQNFDDADAFMTLATAGLGSGKTEEFISTNCNGFIIKSAGKSLNVRMNSNKATPNVDGQGAKIVVIPPLKLENLPISAEINFKLIATSNTSNNEPFLVGFEIESKVNGYLEEYQISKDSGTKVLIENIKFAKIGEKYSMNDFALSLKKMNNSESMNEYSIYQDFSEDNLLLETLLDENTINKYLKEATIELSEGRSLPALKFPTKVLLQKKGSILYSFSASEKVSADSEKVLTSIPSKCLEFFSDINLKQKLDISVTFNSDIKKFLVEVLDNRGLVNQTEAISSFFLSSNIDSCEGLLLREPFWPDQTKKIIALENFGSDSNTITEEPQPIEMKVTDKKGGVYNLEINNENKLIFYKDNRYLFKLHFVHQLSKQQYCIGIDRIQCSKGLLKGLKLGIKKGGEVVQEEDMSVFGDRSEEDMFVLNSTGIIESFDLWGTGLNLQDLIFQHDRIISDTTNGMNDAEKTLIQNNQKYKLFANNIKFEDANIFNKNKATPKVIEIGINNKKLLSEFNFNVRYKKTGNINLYRVKESIQSENISLKKDDVLERIDGICGTSFSGSDSEIWGQIEVKINNELKTGWGVLYNKEWGYQVDPAFVDSFNTQGITKISVGDGLGLRNNRDKSGNYTLLKKDTEIQILSVVGYPDCEFQKVYNINEYTYSPADSISLNAASYGKIELIDAKQINVPYPYDVSGDGWTVSTVTGSSKNYRVCVVDSNENDDCKPIDSFSVLNPVASTLSNLSPGPLKPIEEISKSEFHLKLEDKNETYLAIDLPGIEHDKNIKITKAGNGVWQFVGGSNTIFITEKGVEIIEHNEDNGSKNENNFSSGDVIVQLHDGSVPSQDKLSALLNHLNQKPGYEILGYNCGITANGMAVAASGVTMQDLESILGENSSAFAECSSDPSYQECIANENYKYFSINKPNLRSKCSNTCKSVGSHLLLKYGGHVCMTDEMLNNTNYKSKLTETLNLIGKPDAITSEKCWGGSAGTIPGKIVKADVKIYHEIVGLGNDSGYASFWKDLNKLRSNEDQLYWVLKYGLDPSIDNHEGIKNRLAMKKFFENNNLPFSIWIDWGKKNDNGEVEMTTISGHGIVLSGNSETGTGFKAKDPEFFNEIEYILERGDLDKGDAWFRKWVNGNFSGSHARFPRKLSVVFTGIPDSCYGKFLVSKYGNINIENAPQEISECY